MMSPSTCIIIPLHAKIVAKGMDPTSILSHYSKSLGYDCCAMPFVDVKVKESIEHVSDKEEGIKTIGVVIELICMVPH